MLGRTVYLSFHLDEDDYLLTYLGRDRRQRNRVPPLPARPDRGTTQSPAKAAPPPQEEENDRERLDRLQKKVEQKLVCA